MSPFLPVPSIRLKLIGISMAVVACALAIAGGVFFTTSQRAYTTMVQRDVRSTARVIGENSTAALAFGDPQTAREILATLEATPHMDLACLFDRAGRLFAWYARADARACPASAPAASEHLGVGEFVVNTDVLLDGRSIGTLHLRRNFEDLTAFERSQLVVLVSILAGALLLSLLLSSVLQRLVSAPINHLVDTARQVSERKDYAVRARRTTGDELGVLVDSFNDMLDQVQRTTTELQAMHGQLESKVGELEREVTERQRIEEERSRLLAREREASRLKDEFLATVSHELRTPLNAILGWSRMLASAVLDDQGSHRALQIIERNARAQAHLIEDLLDISRIMSGRLRLEFQSTDLAQVLEAAVDAVRPAAAAKGVHLEFGGLAAPERILGDPDRLQQVVWNLLANAVKFTPPGQRIAMEVTSASDHLTIVVADSGQGIAPEFLPHVFDSFRQADSTSTRQHGGLGLGLAIVRHLVELHGGSVSVASPGVGLGATFTVRLPRPSADRLDRPSGSPSAGGPEPVLDETPPRIDGLRVFVLDDEPDTLSLLVMALEHYGAEVRAAQTVTGALQILATWRPDVIVSDIGLPGEDGYSFIGKVRVMRPRTGGVIPAIALTAYARPSDRVRALGSGFDMHLVKPIEPLDLISAILTLVRRPGASSDARVG